MNTLKRKQDDIFKLWQQRDDSERTDCDAAKLSDEAWNAGVRLHKSQSVHYHLVKEIVRGIRARKYSCTGN